MDMNGFPETEEQFRSKFADEDACREYLAQLKWPEGFKCASCGGEESYFIKSKRVIYECRTCGKQFSVLAGTIFEQSKKPLRLWFRAIFEVTSSKAGISASELKRRLEFKSYQTAWSWLHKIRSAMIRPGRDALDGETEVDEGYLGGPKPGKRGRGAEGKTILGTAVEKRGRGCGRIRLSKLDRINADALIGFVNNKIESGSSVHTDGLRSYAGLRKNGYEHIVSVIANSEKTASEELPRVHLVLSLVKRWVLGTHQGSVSTKHLSGYLEEFTFRFNRRKAKAITHGAWRLLGLAMQTKARPFKSIVKLPDLPYQE